MGCTNDSGTASPDHYAPESRPDLDRNRRPASPEAARVAYSWRSEYLVTAIDCCVAYPIWNEDYGQVDASIRWHMTDNFELSLRASNLTNEETVVRQQVVNADEGGLAMPNAWLQNDRRLTLAFRYNSD